MEAELMDFGDISPIVVPVKIAGRNYELREADGATSIAYRNASLACITLGPGGKAQKLKDMASVESLLVSMCLFTDKGMPVPRRTIEGWPGRVQKALFEKAKDISDLGESDSVTVLLAKALASEGSPIKLEAFREWVSGLADEYKALKEALKPSPEESAKNEQRGTEDGVE